MNQPQIGLSTGIYAGISVLLFLAIAPLPYGYYTLMRIIVCGCAGYIAYKHFIYNSKNIWVWIFGFIAILFNPVAIIHMTKEIWIIVDAVTGFYFLALAYKSASS